MANSEIRFEYAVPLDDKREQAAALLWSARANDFADERGFRFSDGTPAGDYQDGYMFVPVESAEAILKELCDLDLEPSAIHFCDFDRAEVDDSPVLQALLVAAQAHGPYVDEAR